MNINLKEISNYSWFQDEDGNKYDIENPKVTSYYHKFPLQVYEEIDTVHHQEDFDKCTHPIQDVKVTTMAYGDEKIKIKMECQNCGGLLEIITDKHGVISNGWEYRRFVHLITSSTHIGGAEDLIMKMVNDGDYTLREAIMIVSTACERCINVLYNKYGFEDGYQEFSDKWYHAGTSCQFCKDTKQHYAKPPTKNRPEYPDDYPVTLLDKIKDFFGLL